MDLPVLARRSLGELVEDGGEIILVLVAAETGDLLEGDVGMQQQRFGSLDAHLVDVTDNTFAAQLFEKVPETIRAEAHSFRDFPQLLDLGKMLPDVGFRLQDRAFRTRGIFGNPGSPGEVHQRQHHCRGAQIHDRLFERADGRSDFRQNPDFLQNAGIADLREVEAIAGEIRSAGGWIKKQAAIFA